jgi:heterodisulfide reductase subunit B
MVAYQYYPGCSLEGSAREYDRSTRSLMEALGIALLELEDWTCCGASAAEAVDPLLSLCLPARNLALAEQTQGRPALLVPCSACYLNLERARSVLACDAPRRDAVNARLAEETLAVSGRVEVMHLLEVLTRDLGPAAFTAALRRPLSGLRVAPYYGCQCLRPYATWDDPEAPRSMEPLIRACGAQIHPWQMGARCCGAAHMTTRRDVGDRLVTAILEAARGADAIVTVCPMCQMNLEAHQDRLSRHSGRDLRVSVLYLPQLLGIALGLGAELLALDCNLALADAVRERA